MIKLVNILKEVKIKRLKNIIPKGWKEFKVDEKPDFEEDIEIKSWGAPMEGWDTNHLDQVVIYKTPETDPLTDEPLESKYYVKTYYAFGMSFDENEVKTLYDNYSEALNKAIELMEEIMEDWEKDID